MKMDNQTARISKARLWTGYIMSGLPALFLLLDGGMKLFKPDFVVKGTVELGYPEACIIPLGIVLVVSTILYLVPRTSVLGAILLTGYLGGAVATHVRVSGPAFNVAFAVVFGMLLWGGLVLRDQRLGTLLPWKRDASLT
jgi:hypothetical protein